MTFAYGETVTRLRATAANDPYSGEATGSDWSTPDELDIDGCGVAAGGSTEPLLAARNAVDSDFDGESLATGMFTVSTSRLDIDCGFVLVGGP